jgi:uncharacterized membrane protein YgcG
MKKIFTLLASFILTLSLFAAAPRPKTMLTVQSYDQSDIRVVIDGRRFEPNTSYLRIRDMQPGYHQVKVYRERRSGLFTIFGNKYDMVYNNSMFIRPQSNIMITIDRYGRAQMSESRMNGNGRNYGWDDRNHGWSNDNDYDFDHGRNFGDYGDRDRVGNDRDSRWDGRNRNGGSNNGGYGNGSSNNGGGYGNNGGGYGNNGGGNNNGGYGNNSGYGRQMSDYDFSRALNSISTQRGDFQKMESAKQLINTSYFSSIQVKQMLQLFSFENDKLDLAKLAYDKTVDKQNFNVVNDVFSSYSSRDELTRYIRSH